LQTGDAEDDMSDHRHERMTMQSFQDRDRDLFQRP
jgi:hypothetical protein